MDSIYIILALSFFQFLNILMRYLFAWKSRKLPDKQHKKFLETYNVLKDMNKGFKFAQIAQLFLNSKDAQKSLKIGKEENYSIKKV
ncbi:MAG: hypothetical protein R2764_08385 [Bacteroidales bacterium]